MPEVKTLTITALNAITSGVGQYGPWTLYSADVLNEAGEPVNQTFKTFQELPLNTPIPVEVERKETAEYGVEYTLKKPKGARYSLRPSPADADYEELRQRIYAIEQHLGLVAARTDVPAPPVTPAVPARSDMDEVPF